MSINYVPKTIIGFFPQLEEFLSGIKKPLTEKQFGYVFNDKEYTQDEIQELFRDISTAIGASIETVENCFTGDVYGVAIEPFGVKEKNGRFTFATIANAASQCSFIGEKLVALKLNPGLVGVHTTQNVF